MKINFGVQFTTSGIHAPIVRLSTVLALCFLVTDRPVGGQNLSKSAGAGSKGIFNGRAFGATSDGESSDTKAINDAVEQCAKTGGGQVLFPPGRHVFGTIHLKSNITLKLDAGARLIGTTNLNDYARPTPPDYMACGPSKLLRRSPGSTAGNTLSAPVKLSMGPRGVGELSSAPSPAATGPRGRVPSGHRRAG
jgi:hypothetical protein